MQITYSKTIVNKSLIKNFYKRVDMAVLNKEKNHKESRPGRIEHEHHTQSLNYNEREYLLKFRK